MSNKILEEARSHLEKGINDIAQYHDETTFLFGSELAYEFLGSNNKESIVARNVLFTSLAKVLDLTIAHLNKYSQPSDDLLSSVMRLLWGLSEMNIDLGFDFMHNNRGQTTFFGEIY